MTNFRRTLDTAPASDCISGEQRHSTGRRGLRPTTTYEQHRHFIGGAAVFFSSAFLCFSYIFLILFLFFSYTFLILFLYFSCVFLSFLTGRKGKKREENRKKTGRKPKEKKRKEEKSREKQKQKEKKRGKEEGREAPCSLSCWDKTRSCRQLGAALLLRT